MGYIVYMLNGACMYINITNSKSVVLSYHVQQCVAHEITTFIENTPFGNGIWYPIDMLLIGE